jgi:hypothetical protein
MHCWEKREEFVQLAKSRPADIYRVIFEIKRNAAVQKT